MAAVSATFRALFSWRKPEIDYAFAHAKVRKNIRGLKLLSAPLPQDSEISFGKLLIIIPGVAGKAHDRNKLRRQLQAIFYEAKLYETLQLSILLVYKDAMKLSYEDLRSFLTQNLTLP
jgi:ribonuclease P protein component